MFLPSGSIILKDVYTYSDGPLSFSSVARLRLVCGLGLGSSVGQFCKESSCGHGTKTVIQTHKSINEWRIRMFRPTDMDPRTKGVIRRPPDYTLCSGVHANDQMRPTQRKYAFGTCADSEGPDQTARTRSLIRVFAVRQQTHWTHRM